MNYISQRDKYRCGPVAVFNALRWAGEQVTYEKDIKRLTRLCECKPPRGTTYRPLVRTLRKEGRGLFTVRAIVQPSMSDFDRNLDQGNILVWNMKHERGRHYALVVGKKNNSYQVANMYEGVGEAVVSLRQKQIQEFVEGRDRLHRIWVLSKVQDDDQV